MYTEPSAENLDTRTDVFSYQNLNQHFIHLQRSAPIVDRGYRARLGGVNVASRDFILFMRDRPSPRNSTADIEESSFVPSAYQLKFHVTLPENDRALYAEGWNRVKEILMRHNIFMFKVPHEGVRMSESDPDSLQRGKDITIYASSNPQISVAEWQGIITEITQALATGEQIVPPGYRTIREGPRADCGIQGTNYVSYRYGESDQSALPEGVEDPLINMNIHLEGVVQQPNMDLRFPQQRNCCTIM